MNDITAPADVGQLDRRDIPGWEGLYAVTSDGRVWAYPRKWTTGKGRVVALSHDGKWLRPQVNSRTGYLQVQLTVDGVGVLAKIHRLVSLAWIPNPHALPQINHLNGVKKDNRAVNLEWCTASTNTKHAVATGLIKIDEAYRAAHKRNSLASSAKTRRFSMEQATEIRRRYSSGETQVSLAKAFSVRQTTISNIVRGKHYAE